MFPVPETHEEDDAEATLLEEAVRESSNLKSQADQAFELGHLDEDAVSDLRKMKPLINLITSEFSCLWTFAEDNKVTSVTKYRRCYSAAGRNKSQVNSLLKKANSRSW